MLIETFFTNNGVPAVGLNPPPKIRILNADTGALLVDSTETELGDGFYTFDFTDFNKDLRYAIRVDGRGQLSGFDRWAFHGNEDPSDFQSDLNAIRRDLTTGTVDVNAIRDAILDEVVDSTTHFGLDTVGEALTLVRGLIQQNFMIDDTTHNGAGLMVAGRIRLFGTKELVDAATDGGRNEGEFATFSISSIGETGDPCRVKSYRVTRRS